MFLRWLMTDFPRDMRRGWLLLRADLGFWCVVAAVLAVLPLIPLEERSGQGDSFATIAALAFTALVHVVVPLVLMAAAVRFAAVREARRPAVVQTVKTRLVPVTIACLAAAVLCRAAGLFVAAVVVAIMQRANQGADVVGLWAALVEELVFVVLLVRFAFVPFVATLQRRSDFGTGSDERGTLGALVYRTAWPLVESGRMTADVRRELLPYVILAFYAPGIAAAAPALVRPLAFFALQLLSFAALAVVFTYYAERVRAADGEQAAVVSPAVCA
jgi:hypothetical protein